MELYFSQHFAVDPQILKEYGALDASLVSDLPLFIDPFLLFNSEDPVYQGLHEQILRYLRFLRDEANKGALDEASIQYLFRFSEVKQNWLGFTMFGNEGSGLGARFASALHEALGDIVSDFGKETITRGSHLEKLCLIQPGVGQDNISDFTTNLIKGYLCEYTEVFAKEHLDDEHCDDFRVDRASFNYETKTWVTTTYRLPRLKDNFVLLSPIDMLTREDTWINHSDMISKFAVLPPAVSNEEQRSRIDAYFQSVLAKDAKAKEKREAAVKTIRQFPELIDLYIRLQEDQGDKAEAISAEKVYETEALLIAEIQEAIEDLQSKTDFYARPWTTFDECLERVKYFKDYIENNDGYRLFNPEGNRGSTEKEIQLAFGLVWGGTELDVNREANNGRGQVDFKASYGAGDKSLIEFKLARNSQLKRNLQNQVDIYKAANKTPHAVKVIVSYTADEHENALKILKELEIDKDESVVLVDARNDNKPSASTA